MGFPAPLVDFLFFEHVHKPIRGDVAFLARQTTYLDPASLQHLGRKYGITPPAGARIDLDPNLCIFNPRKNGSKRGSIDDRTLMRFLGVDKVTFVDVSDYEGADVICDLSQPIPAELHGRFDFIYDGSCLDNIFNPAQALENASRMLRPGGRLLVMEHVTPLNGPYTIFTTNWFYDFFCANRYRDCKVYLGLFKDNQALHIGPWPFFLVSSAANSSVSMPVIPPGMHAMAIIIAEKDGESTDSVLPIQHIYRPNTPTVAAFNDAVLRLRTSPRPVWGFRPGEHPADNVLYPRLKDLGADLPIRNFHFAQAAPAQAPASAIPSPAPRRTLKWWLALKPLRRLIPEYRRRKALRENRMIGF